NQCYRDLGWDAWGPWSDCSRTCGGGASYSLRRCLNRGNCDGKNIRYRTCSNTDCPAESGDFRAQQCSAHNDIKYQGVTYEWVPAPYDPAVPCALRCQAKGWSLMVELAPKVLDGTRCRSDAFDMCISGVCQVRRIFSCLCQFPVFQAFLHRLVHDNCRNSTNPQITSLY
uniref:ADAMTS-like 3 n=1 Tax=Sphaeramia orbicularis TaxID=375764 RepID=A0A672Y8H8_9TELE